MPLLPIEQMPSAGAQPDYKVAGQTDSGTADEWPQTFGDVHCRIFNPGAAFGATFKGKQHSNQGFLNDLVVSVGTGESTFGPFPPERFGNPVRVEYAAPVAGVGIAIVRSPNLGS